MKVQSIMSLDVGQDQPILSVVGDAEQLKIFVNCSNNDFSIVT